MDATVLKRCLSILEAVSINRYRFKPSEIVSKFSPKQDVHVYSAIAVISDKIAVFFFCSPAFYQVVEKEVVFENLVLHLQK